MKKIKKTKISILPLAAVICIIIALSVNGKVPEKDSLFSLLREELGGVSLTAFLLALSVLALYVLKGEAVRIHRSRSAVVIGLLFALFTVTGLSFSENGSLAFVTRNPGQFFIACVTLIGYWCLFTALITLLYTWLDGRAGRQTPGDSAEDASEMEKWDSSLFLRSFLVILLCWLPFMIVYWPGTLSRDAYRSLNMGMGIWPLTNHQPWLMSLFLTALFKCGRVISDNMGIFVTVLVLALLQAVSYAEICTKLRKWGASKRTVRVVILFFGIMPVFAAYSQTLIKDGLASALMAMYVVHYLDLAWMERRDQEMPPSLLWKKMGLILLFGILTCFARRNNIFAVMPMAIVMPFLLKKGHRRIVLLLVAGLAAGYLGHTAAGKLLHVKNGSPRVYFTIPFQQTARYLKEYPEDVTQEELETIDRLLDVSVIAEYYTPESSDRVKNTFRGGIGMEELLDYFRVWGQMLRRHPLVYVEATLHNSYGYYYPFRHTQINNPFYFEMAGGVYDTGTFDFHYVFPKKVRNILRRYAFLWQNIPLLAQLVNAGTYTWIYLILAGYLFHRRKYRLLTPFAGFAALLAIFTASPINGCVRYYLPVMVCMPMMMYWTLAADEPGQAVNRSVGQTVNSSHL